MFLNKIAYLLTGDFRIYFQKLITSIPLKGRQTCKNMDGTDR